MSKAEKELYTILDPELHWNKARLTCFVKMLLALFAVKTINLTSIATAFDSDAKASSRYKRVQRFFRLFHIDFTVVARFIFKWFLLNNGKHYLIVDRTNWKLGKQDINVLMLSVAHEGIAIPLFWINLGRSGNSNTTQRIELINKYIEAFGTDNIAGLLGDREFIGKEWFEYLLKHKIALYIRIKDNTKIPNSKGMLVPVKQLFHGMHYGEIKILRNINVWGITLSLSATLDKKGEFKIIATDRNPENSISIYATRQEIETLFGCLKTRGFRFEDTHVTAPDRIDRLLVLLAIGFCWAYKIGEWRHQNVAPIKLKSHGRRAVSIFRYGLDFVRDTCSKLQRRYSDFKLCLRRLKPPKNAELPLLVEASI